jgi:16S rRNA (adenine1518-N6/adenine1519-N6)-dimethyltransferase
MKHFGHAPKKRFGQHFLSDAAIIDAIVQEINPEPGQCMVEIGPGLGALTLPLLKRIDYLTVIELDRDLAVKLQQNPKLTVVQDDVLRVDFSKLMPPIPQSLRVVGNLPYNISTPILFHLVGFAERIVDQHFMLQKEVIDRMVARPGTSDFGRLSVMLQARYMMENILFVGPECFTPPPRVDSAIVRMVPLPEAELANRAPWRHLESLVRVAFSQRRKLLKHSLGLWLLQQGYDSAFDLQRRAQDVPVEEYLELARETATQMPSP